MDNTFYSLKDGQNLPAIGLGTVGIQGAVGINQLLTAFEAGYRLIDTSTNYNNEGMVGEAIRRSNIPREEFMVTSKLPGAAHQYDNAIKLIQESLYRLGLDYFDLYLIHWPLPKQNLYDEAWQALIDAQKFGLIKSIGVSNFLPDHLDKIINKTGVAPSVNQIERHPRFNNKELVAANQERDILTEAWSPLGRNLTDILGIKIISAIAEKHGKTPAQIVIRWNLENDVLPIVKSGSYQHQLENLNVLDFELDDIDCAQIDNLDKGEKGRVEGQHPNEYEEFE